MQAEFKQGPPILFCIIFAVVCCVIGAVLAVVLEPWIGIVAVCAGLLIPLLVWYLGTSYVIRCSDSGFAIDESSRRKGRRHSEYRWADVSRTEYEEIQSRRTGDRPSSGPIVYFSVFCGEERAFKVGRIGRLRDLIKFFNSMTPQLPYTWEPRKGLTIQLGPVTAGNNAFVKAPRANTGRAPAA